MQQGDHRRSDSLRIAGGSRSPVTSIRARRASIAAMSSSERLTSAAPRFSFTRSRRRVPKIGTMLGPLARSQASATCAAVAPLAAASCSTASTTAWLASIASGVKRGDPARKSFTPKLDVLATLPVAHPERAPGHEADAQFLAERQHLRLWVAGPQRVFALDRGDRLDGMGAADGVRRRF